MLSGRKKEMENTMLARGLERRRRRRGWVEGEKLLEVGAGTEPSVTMV